MTAAKLRLVLDTSVIVAAFRSRGGASHRLLRVVAQRRAVMIASPALFLEYEMVLTRPEHSRQMGRAAHMIGKAMEELAALIEPVVPRIRWRPQLSDQDDEMVLDAAVNGKANILVTFDVRDFAALPSFGVRVARPAAALKEIGE
jgi:putative PIN family toxin of toxin-antitoxin system